MARRPSDELREPVTPEAWEQALAAEFAAFVDETRAAMNAAREGHWIADTEEVVRDAGARLRQRALEQLLQLRVPAGKGAFSPAGPLGRVAGPGTAAGAAPDRRRARDRETSAMVAGRTRDLRARR